MSTARSVNSSGPRTVRVVLTLFIPGSGLSGITAIPLVSQVNALVRLTSADEAMTSTWAVWLRRIQTVLRETADEHPVLFHGTDWLAFGHLVIAVAFIGAWKDPMKNEWLFDFGLIACVMVIPWAFCSGLFEESRSGGAGRLSNTTSSRNPSTPSTTDGPPGHEMIGGPLKDLGVKNGAALKTRSLQMRPRGMNAFILAKRLECDAFTAAFFRTHPSPTDHAKPALTDQNHSSP